MSDDVRRLLKSALSRPERVRLAVLEGTDTWRIVNGAGDGMEGFTVDRFDPAILIEQHKERLNPGSLIDAVSHAYGVEAPIFLKERWSPSAPGWEGRQVSGPPLDSDLVIEEGGLSFAVSLCGQEHVGLFLDSRPARELVGSISSGRRVLNLFSYTGGFGVAAAAGRARSTTNVDNKRSALDGARVNYRLNGLPSDSRSFMRSDALKFLAAAQRGGTTYDLIILDPPPRFRRGGRTDFVAGSGYGPLVAKCLAVLSPDGLLLAGLNSLSVDDCRFEEMLMEGSERAKIPVAVVERIGPGGDFPDGGDRPLARFVLVKPR